MHSFSIFLKVYTNSLVPLQYLHTKVQQMSNILTQIYSTMCLVHATLANFGLHAGMKFSTQNEYCVNISISIILPLCLPVYHEQ